MKTKTIILLILLLAFQCGFSQDKSKIEEKYQKAKSLNTEKAYNQIIKKFPNSDYADSARLAKIFLKDSIKVVISTYLGNEKRNYYGNKAPNKLDTIWKLYLGEGLSPAYGIQKIWKGAGWTGQPLFVREKGKNYLIQPSFDYNLKKIDAETGEIIWEYKFDDILKGTPSLWINTKAKTIENRYVIIQGSRLGVGNVVDSTEIVPSLRAVSYITGKELWRMNVIRTYSYSRDVDGSALVYKDTAYLALENGLFTVFNPNPENAKYISGILQPEKYKEIVYFNDKDTAFHGRDLVSESSPTLYNNRVFTPSGSGHVYGYNILTGKNDFDFFTGTDMNGSAPLTNDNCLIVAIEKQYMPGQGGVMKIDPSKQGPDRVVWFFPTPDFKWFHWEGGIIGSASINDSYAQEKDPKVAVFVDVTGHLYIVNHEKIDANKKSIGPDGITEYNMPELLFDERIAGTISTPIIIDDKIIAATDKGIFLFKINFENMSIEYLDMVKDLEIDATPIAVDGRLYIASRNGYMYCFGQK